MPVAYPGLETEAGPRDFEGSLLPPGFSFPVLPGRISPTLFLYLPEPRKPLPSCFTGTNRAQPKRVRPSVHSMAR